MFDFSKVVDRHGTWCTQWDYVADRFGTADLLPFTISDMDFATAPCIIEALNQRLIHGVFGYSRWKNDEFLAAIAHWFSTQHYTAIDPQSVVYGPSVIYMVSELIRQWSETGEGVVIHTPAYDAFYKAIEGNQRTVMPVALEKQPDGWFCDMGKLEAVLAKPECKILLTSQTNLAVDNALERLQGQPGIRPIRIGKPDKLEPEGRRFSIPIIDSWTADSKQNGDNAAKIWIDRICNAISNDP